MVSSRLTRDRKVNKFTCNEDSRNFEGVGLIFCCCTSCTYCWLYDTNPIVTHFPDFTMLVVTPPHPHPLVLVLSSGVYTL